jgi:hypothetical protein
MEINMQQKIKSFVKKCIPQSILQFYHRYYNRWYWLNKLPLEERDGGFMITLFKQKNALLGNPLPNELGKTALLIIEMM